ncbi:MAG: hypothetical protein ACXVEF_01060 [Polyangiales bacterium]
MRSLLPFAFASALALPLLACTKISGVGDLEVTDLDCVKDCPDVGGDTTSDTPVDAPAGTLTLDPPESVVFIDTSTSPPTVGSVTFKASLKLDDGSTKDVSDSATFTIDDTTMGTFAGPKLTTGTSLPGKAATTLVHASANGAMADARVSVVVMRKGVDFFITAPKDGTATPEKSVILSNSAIAQIDVALIQDTTGSMGGAIDNVKANLKSSLFPTLKSLVPDAAIAIVDHRDYPVNPYGDTTDYPVKVLQTVTSDVTLADTAAAKLVAGGGFDGPEAQIPAMFHVLTGNALAWTGGMLDRHDPPAGTSGAVEFRNNSLEVIALVTDVDWHGEGHTPYMGFVAPTMADLKGAYAKTAAKFIDITNGTISSPEDQANDLSDATKSSVPVAAFGGTCGAGQCCTGIDSAARAPVGTLCRLNFLHDNGKGVSAAIQNAVRAMTKGLSFGGGIGAFLSNDPLNPDGTDILQLVKLRAMDEGTSDCLARSATDTDGDMVNDSFSGSIGVDTKLCFELSAKNASLAGTGKPQFVIGYFDILGQPGAVRLDRRMVVVMIPG